MKLYVEEGELLLDYSDVNFGERLDKVQNEYYDFLRSCSCRWERTLKPKIKRIAFQRNDRDELYDLSELRSLTGNAYYAARRLKFIDISDTVKRFMDELDERIHVLTEQLEAKRLEEKRKKRWKDVCKFGCGGCGNLRRCEDDYICGASGELLPERNIPGNVGAVYRIFNYVPFPTDSCPLNVEN